MEPEAADKLAAKQDELAKKIDELAAVGQAGGPAPRWNRPSQEAQEAANNLLEQKQPEALAHQDKAALDLKAAAHEAEKTQPASDQAGPDRRGRQTAGTGRQDRPAWPLPPRSWKRPPRPSGEIAKDANQAAEKEGLKPEQAAGLEKKNEEATENAKAARSEVANSVPKADEEVKKALDAMRKKPRTSTRPSRRSPPIREDRRRQDRQCQ